MYLCICNVITEKALQDAAKYYDSVEEFLLSRKVNYKCALCKKILESHFEKHKKEIKNEKN
jgi:bacterioferritin-associated ferredoxin